MIARQRQKKAKERLELERKYWRLILKRKVEDSKQTKEQIEAVQYEICMAMGL